jgi:haloalkane dehalogenase
MAFMEAILAPARWRDFRGAFKAAFKLFRAPYAGGFVISGLNVFVKRLLPRTVVRKLTAEEMAYYLEPYPTFASRRAVRQWPREIPIDGRPADVHAAVAEYHAWLQRTRIPKLLLHARPGALIHRRVVEKARQRFPSLETVDIGPGLHFVQEDNPHGIGRAIAAWGRRRS